jgi:hypothetical protein
MAFEDDGSPAWGQGTSEASAEVSAVLASMRAYSPTITARQAEQCVTSTEVRGGNGDVAQAFRACGLRSVVDQGNAASRAANTPPTAGKGPTPSSGPGPKVPQLGQGVALPLPRLDDVTFKRHSLAVHALNLPTGAQMAVSVGERVARRYSTIATKTVASAWARLHVSGWDRVIVRFIEPTANLAPSPPITIARRHRSRRFASLGGRR